MRWILIFLVVESCLWGGSLNSARADIIGFQFSGSWTSVDPAFTNLTGGVDQPVTGSIYYDTTITDKDSIAKRAYYYGNDKIINLSFTTNAAHIQIQKARIAIYANYNGNKNSLGFDQFQLWFSTQSDGQGKVTSMASLPQDTTGSFLLKDETNKNLFNNDDSLPSNLDPLRLMSTMSFTLSRSPEYKDEAVAKITSLTTLPVPEPETIILLCLGLALIFLWHGLNNRKGGFQQLRA
ncbi:MAG TPA: PEP-CTERM sorting domain-containing protein [Desulfobacterales bacterium]|nr:PEP-CTERM sorting domain-containing protein [Desulfobacterales bacterium]